MEKDAVDADTPPPSQSTHYVPHMAVTQAVKHIYSYVIRILYIYYYSCEPLAR